MENILSKDPYVATFKGLLSDEECQHFIDISRNLLKPSKVICNNGGICDSKARTSSSTFIKHNHDEITEKVGERISKIVNMPLENAESYQIIHYKVSQEYKAHYDSLIHDYSDRTLKFMEKGGARMKTALCYLNDVTKGGETKMTKINITIPPEKGKLLVFNNTVSDLDNTRHNLSEHAALPVIEGEKFAFNLWFRECNYNMLYKDFNPNYYSFNKKKREEEKEKEKEKENLEKKN